MRVGSVPFARTYTRKALVRKQLVSLCRSKKGGWGGGDESTNLDLDCETDEMIRQVAIECPERGLLLQRVRDELRMTISAYQTCVVLGILLRRRHFVPIHIVFRLTPTSTVQPLPQEHQLWPEQVDRGRICAARAKAQSGPSR